jgi:hypothetical protein
MLRRRLFAWWLGLKELLLTNDCVEVQTPRMTFDCATWESKVRVLKRLTRWVQTDYQRVEALRPVFERYAVDIAALLEDQGLSEDDVRHIAAHPLVTIGAHTTSHRALCLLSKREAQLEILENKSYLEGLIGQTVTHFAYPFGDEAACGPREAKIAHHAGFETAVTTRTGLVFRVHREHPMAIPRIGISNRETIRSLACKVRGVTSMIYGRFGNPIKLM